MQFNKVRLITMVVLLPSPQDVVRVRRQKSARTFAWAALSTKTTSSSSGSREYGLRGSPRLLPRTRLDPELKREHTARNILWLDRITFPAPFTADQAVTVLNNADFEVEIRRNYILGATASAFPGPMAQPGLCVNWCTYAQDTTVGSPRLSLDTGIDISRPDLANNIWSNLKIPNNGRDDNNGFAMIQADFVAKDASAIDESYAGHGTAVAVSLARLGTMVEESGVAWEVQLMPVQVLGEDGKGTLFNISNGINTRRKMVQISLLLVSRTLSGVAGLDAEPIQEFVNNGGLFIAAARQGSNNDLYPHFPASYGYNGVFLSPRAIKTMSSPRPVITAKYRSTSPHPGSRSTP